MRRSMKTRSLRSSSTSISFWVPLAGKEMFNFIFAREGLWKGCVSYVLSPKMLTLWIAISAPICLGTLALYSEPIRYEGGIDALQCFDGI